MKTQGRAVSIQVTVVPVAHYTRGSSINQSPKGTPGKWEHGDPQWGQEQLASMGPQGTVCKGPASSSNRLIQTLMRKA